MEMKMDYEVLIKDEKGNIAFHLIVPKEKIKVSNEGVIEIETGTLMALSNP